MGLLWTTIFIHVSSDQIRISNLKHDLRWHDNILGIIVLKNWWMHNITIDKTKYRTKNPTRCPTICFHIPIILSFPPSNSPFPLHILTTVQAISIPMLDYQSRKHYKFCKHYPCTPACISIHQMGTVLGDFRHKLEWGMQHKSQTPQRNHTQSR